MLQPGLKVGPSDWKPRLEDSGARYCEVWYNAQEPEKYEDLFAYLTSHHINTGLHFWGTINGIWEPNVAYPGPTLDKTLKLIKDTIDIASSNKFHYVNIHCGNRQLVKLNLVSQQFIPDESTPELSIIQAETIQRQSLLKLHQYATSKKVMLLLEPVPAQTAISDRQHAVSQHSLPVASVIRRAQHDGLLVTNDFGHIFADEFDQPLEYLWQALWQKSVALAPHTKLVHVNTIVPPYNGTDSHHGITTADFKLPGIFPTRNKLIRLLKLFDDRDDVWAINEPMDNHVANFKSLQKLLKEL